MADCGKKEEDSTQEENPADGGEKEEKQEPTVSMRRKLKTLTFGRKKKSFGTKEKKKRINPVWGFKLCTRNDSSADISETAGEYRTKESKQAKPSTETVQNKGCDQSSSSSSSRCKTEGQQPSPGSLKKSCMSAYKNDLPSQRVHTQIDYIHCLVPDLLAITNCSFYWGKMDRYEAEKLLDKKSEGTFLLRDSAQEDHLFSVSFRRFDRSLHARIEQWNHRFSFDSHDPGVFSSPTVCGLIEHYKDAGHCMFFEPMLTIPLHRVFPFSLQHLCRSVICSRLTYDAIDQIELPKTLKNSLKEYHYKQQVRVRRLDVDQS